MSRLRRYNYAGSTYFITCITLNRQRFLLDNAGMLKKALDEVCERTSAKVMAWSIMPEHFHVLLEVGDLDISHTMKSVKETFSFRYRSLCGTRSGRIWQHRFWDHIIRDQEDFNKHADYIHYNPVKHGLVASPGEHAMSSFSDYFGAGFYGPDWGVTEIPETEGEFGE